MAKVKSDAKHDKKVARKAKKASKKKRKEEKHGDRATSGSSKQKRSVKAQHEHQLQNDRDAESHECSYDEPSLEATGMMAADQTGVAVSSSSSSSPPRPAAADEPSGKPNDAPSKAPPKKRKKKKKPHQQSPSKPPLHGMILSISTLEERGKTHEHSYKTVRDLAQNLGATVTTQVHKRVRYVVCTPSAIHHATQRVRKAVKRKIALVDVAWLLQCCEDGAVVDVAQYRVDAAAVSDKTSNDVAAVDGNVTNGNSNGNCDDDDVVPQLEMIVEDAGWTEAQSLGCCCVCHENGTTDACPWCRDGCK